MADMVRQNKHQSTDINTGASFINNDHFDPSTGDPETQILGEYLFGSSTSTTCWHALTVEETTRTIRAREDHQNLGLTSSEAAKRLTQYGPNEMTVASPRSRNKSSTVQKIWKQTANVFVLMLMGK